MSHRFRFIGEFANGRWSLEAEEAQHLAKVLRLGVGEDVEVTDGRGQWAVGRVAAVTSSGKRVEIDPVGDSVEEPRPAWALKVCIGALKPGLLDEILPGMTELGVDEVHVFLQQESAKARVADKAVERWHRIVVQAVKQCKRAWVPEVVVHPSARAMVEAMAGDGTRRLITVPGAERTLMAALESGKLPAAGMAIAIGGEKGFSEDEERTLRGAGFEAASLGPFVLRAVTAAISVCSIATAVRSATTVIPRPFVVPYPYHPSIGAPP